MARRTKKEKLLRLIEDMKFEHETDYIYAFILAGMAYRKFTTPSGHNREVKEFVKKVGSPEKSGELETTEEEKQIRQYRGDICSFLCKISDERFLRRLWISTKDYVIEKGGVSL